MSTDEWDERALEYKRQREKGQQNLLRISKDTAGLIHACLIPYDELDELSVRENSITGKNVDYKQLDRDNVSVIINMLSIKKTGKGSGKRSLYG